MELNPTVNDTAGQLNQSTGCPGLILAPGDDIVSWQSAFWGIVPIALNSMLAPNGQVLSLPSSWGLALRSSPILCAFDALELALFWLTLTLFGGEGPSVAAKRVARVRFRDVVDDTSARSITSLRKDFWVVQAVFIIGTGAQAIKLFACSGIGGTQVCAALYLASWTVSEALVWTAGKDWRTDVLEPLPPGTLDDISRSGLLPWIPLHVIGTIMHCRWIEGCLDDALGQHFDINGDLPGQLTEGVLWMSVALILGAVAPYVLYHTESRHAIELSPAQLYYFPHISFATCVLYYLWNSMVDYVNSTGPWIHCAYIGFWNFYMFMDFYLCAYTRATREKLKGIVPLMEMIALGGVWMLYSPRSLYADIVSWILTTVFSVLLIVAFFPGSAVQFFISKVRILGHLRVPLVRQQHFIYAVSVIGLLYTVVLVGASFFVYVAALQVVPAGTFLGLALCHKLIGARSERFSLNAAGICFVSMNGLGALLWYVNAWADNYPECSMQPGWTKAFG